MAGAAWWEHAGAAGLDLRESRRVKCLTNSTSKAGSNPAASLTFESEG